MRLSLLLFFLLLISKQLTASALDTIVIDKNFKSKELGKGVEYISTEEEKYSIQSLLTDTSVKYKRYENDLLIFSEEEYEEDLWLKLDIKNELETDKRLFLLVDNALINYVEFFEVSNAKVISSELMGDAFPVNDRSIKYRNPIFNIKLYPHESKSIYVYIKIGGRKVHVPMQLYVQEKFIEKITQNESNLAFYYGILVALSVLSIMFYYLIKEQVYIYFASYLTSQTLLQLAVSGFAAVYIWPQFPFWIDRSVPILMSLTLITGLSFVIEFIHKTKFKNWQLYLIRAYQFLAVLIIVSCFFEGDIYYAGVWLLYRLIPPFYFGLIILAVYFFSKRYFPARFFIVGVAGSMVSMAAIFYFSTLKIHNNIFTNEYVIFGEVMKCVMITLALLDRFRFFKEEKAQMQSMMIEQLEELNQYKENINKNLTELVEAKTQELNRKQTEISKALLIGEELERKRVATELHDGIGSLLSTLKLNAESIDIKTKGFDEKEQLAYQNVIDLIDRACVELRNISHNMMPTGIEQFGPIHSLNSIIKKITQTEKINFNLQVDKIDERFNRDFELSIYRIVLELINNILKHSMAKNATIQILRSEEHLSILVEDDGEGFDTSAIKEGMGFVNIQSRVKAFNGKFTIDSNIGKGSTFIVELPII